MALSVSEAVSDSFDWVKLSLFKRFSWKKWFVIGFSAFLATLGKGGGSNGASNVMRLANLGKGNGLQQIQQWIMAHLIPIILIGSGIALLTLGFAVLFLWLSSRGKFMFLYGVVKDKPLLSEPWNEYRKEGHSLFFFRLIIGVIAFVVIFGLLVLGVVVLLRQGWRSGGPHGAAVAGLIAGACFVMLLALVFVVIMQVLEDFIVPIMFLRRVKTMTAFAIFRRDVLAGRVGTLIIFYVLKFVLGLAAGIVIIVITLITCCIAVLPYISSVVFLPILYFFRCLPLFLLEQLGSEWRFFPDGWKDEIMMGTAGRHMKAAPIGMDTVPGGSLPDGGPAQE